MQPDYIITPELIQRFWAKVSQTPDENGCLNWNGSIRGRMSYGSFRIGRCVMNAHRAGWILTYGYIPPKVFVCHKCDNPKCCNLDHLFLGSNLDNMRDMVAKKRGRGHGPLGEQNGAAKLTSRQVDEIRERWASGDITQRELATIYGVKQPNISDIVNYKKRIQG